MSDTNEHKPIRVCFISLQAYPIFNPHIEELFGGAEVDFYLLSTELAKDKAFEVSFIVGDYGQEPLEVREGVTLIKSVDIEKNLFLGGGKIWKALCKADADMYVDEACSLGTALYAFFCKFHGKSFVYRTASSRECNGTYIREKPFRGKAVLWAFRNANKVITQNQSDNESLLENMGVSSVVIRNATRLLAQEMCERNTILWVARSAEVKQPGLFLKMAMQVPDEHFTIVCPKATGDENYDRLVSKAREINNVEFLEEVAFHKIDDYFKRAKVFVSTSDSEGFPNTFVQACKSATPILSLNVNPDNFLDKYGCGICANGSWDDLISGLKRLLDSEEGQKCGSNGRSYAEKEHDVTRIIESYKEIFKELLGR